ncbi:MAG: ABC transporter ATP-binding protein [Thermoplasmata archaeon]
MKRKNTISSEVARGNNEEGKTVNENERTEEKVVWAVEIEKLVKEYGTFRALDGLDLKIKKGELYGLLGPNGAGKTTSIKVLMGLTPPTRYKTLKIFNTLLPNREIRKRIGYMPQETAIYQNLTVHENLMMWGEIFEMDRGLMKEREKILLDLVNLTDWRDAVITTLSGGMKHRASLICTLIHDPDLLVLDEPTVGVDPELRKEFWDFFHRISKTGKTIIITTHYMDEASNCSKVGLIRQGKLIAEGSPAEILQQSGTKSLEEAFVYYCKRQRKYVNPQAKESEGKEHDSSKKKESKVR